MPYLTIIKTLDQTIDDNHMIDVIIGKGNFRCQNCRNRSNSRYQNIDRVNYRCDFSNDRNRGRTREQSLTPRGDDRKYQSLVSGSGNRTQSNSRLAINRDRVRCYKYREYYHLAQECSNTVTDDSDGYDSDGATLLLLTTHAEIHQKFDGVSPIEEPVHLNL